MKSFEQFKVFGYMSHKSPCTHWQSGLINESKNVVTLFFQANV